MFRGLTLRWSWQGIPMFWISFNLMFFFLLYHFNRCLFLPVAFSTFFISSNDTFSAYLKNFVMLQGLSLKKRSSKCYFTNFVKRIEMKENRELTVSLGSSYHGLVIFSSPRKSSFLFKFPNKFSGNWQLTTGPAIQEIWIGLIFKPIKHEPCLYRVLV